MSEWLRETMLLVAVVFLIITAVVEPGMRYLGLIFAVVGMGLYLRRRRRRLERAALEKVDPTP